MVEEKIKFKKKREVGEIISDSFTFIKQEYRPVLKLVVTYVLPFLVLYAVVLVYLQKNVISKIDFTDAETLKANIGPFYTNILLFSVFGIFVQALLVSAYYSYIEAYVEKGPGNFDLSEVTPSLFSNGLLALGAALAMFVVVMFGFILFFVPGIYFANTFSIVIAVYIFEKKGFSNAFARSMFLVNRQWWNTFLLNIVGILIIWVAGFVLSIPSLIAGISTNMLDGETTIAANYPDWYWLVTGITTVVSSVLWIVPYTFLAMQYFNLNERFQSVPTSGNVH